MNTTIDRLAQRLESELGAGFVVTSGEDVLRIDGVAAGLSVRPETAEQAAAVVRVCAEADAAMIPCGGGTALSIGNPPRRADAVVRLGRLGRVIEHDAANLTVSVECGITIAALNSALAAERQQVALHPPFPERATVGGTMAANVNGPWRHGHGAIRDLVIGIKAILPSGQSIKGGGKVVKNVAGYDMSKLFVGSLGTLGVVAEATLRVAPIPEAAATLMADGSLGGVDELIRQVRSAALLPTAVFLRGAHSLQRWRVAVRCEGFAAAVKRQLRDLEAMALGAGMRAQFLTAQEDEPIWSELRDFPLLPDCVMVRVTLPRSNLFALIDASRTWNPAELVCDASGGTIWLAFPPSRRAIAHFQEIEARARRHRGHGVLWTAPATLKKGVNVWGEAPVSLGIMREIKRQFDPAELFNPGRFVGGL